LNLILAYTRIFENSDELIEHILKDAFSIVDNKFKTGSEIYLCDLKKSYHSYGPDIFLVDSNIQNEMNGESYEEMNPLLKRSESLNLEP